MQDYHYTDTHCSQILNTVVVVTQWWWDCSSLLGNIGQKHQRQESIYRGITSQVSNSPIIYINRPLMFSTYYSIFTDTHTLSVYIICPPTTFFPCSQPEKLGAPAASFSWSRIYRHLLFTMPYILDRLFSMLCLFSIPNHFAVWKV